MQRKRLHIALIVSVVIAVFPFVWLPFMSLFSDWKYPNVFPNNLDFQQWVLFFNGQQDVRCSFFLSLFIAITTAGTSTALGFGLARLVSYNRRRKLGVFWSLLPVTISPVLFATILAFYFNVTGMAGTVPGVIIAQLLIAIPFSIIYFTAFWSPRVADMEQLAATLGSRPSQTFRKVVLPYARPFLLVCFFQTFIISWFEYGLTSVIGAGQVQTLTLKVYLYVQEASPSLAALAATLLIIPPALLLWFNRQYVFKPLGV